MTPISEILLDATDRYEAVSWLIPGGTASLAMGITTAHPNSAVSWQPIDCREVQVVVDIPANLSIQSPGEPADAVEAVVIAATPDRGLARRWLLMARKALVDGGRVFVAGANDVGIRSVIADGAKLFGSARREDYRSKHRIAEFNWSGKRLPDPAWASEPGIGPGTWQEFPLAIGDRSVPLATQAGVFAGDRVDAGTRLLLDALPICVTGRVLDVGCGAGVIGIAAALRGANAVDMTDTNLLAVGAAQESVRRLSESGDHGGSSVATIDVFASDVFSAVGDERYDLIASNPPFHRGKTIDYTVADRLITEAPEHLADGGSLLIVANAFLAYGKRMERVFAAVETIAATRQYHVLRASQPRSRQFASGGMKPKPV